MEPPRSARRVALDALDRIDGQGAYANLALPALLQRSGLEPRDRRFATDLVYGTTRMRRACDFLVDRFMERSPVPRVRNALRLGAYQLVYGGVPAHAGVAETVAITPQSSRGLVNAVLRKVAADGADVDWPDDATRLSYPDWIVDRLTADLGRAEAIAALEAMNEPATVSERADGYIQDPASQQVATAVGAQPGEQVLDVCAAPGGKATALASSGARIIAADQRAGRLDLIRENAGRLELTDQLVVVAADGTRPPWRPASFDRVLVDAPCSGLGTLRRRPDLRWRVEPDSVDRLAELQRQLLDASVPLLRPGGTLVYSVCTLTAAETLAIDDWLAEVHPELKPLDRLGEPWQPWGRGTLVLPQAEGTDGMALLRCRKD
ncbi:MAG TPA: transcription antitermination factor NusB [Acidimicrobiales bacterium]